MIALIIILILFCTFVVLLWKNRPPTKKKSYKVVKAGNVSCVYPVSVELKDILNKRFVSDKEAVDVDKYEIFVVRGNSMSNNGVQDRDAVFIKRLYGGEKYQIQNLPIIILEIDKGKDISTLAESKNEFEFVEFKLRKFIGYIDGNSKFEEWFPIFENKFIEISENKESIKEKFDKCISSYKSNNQNTEKFSLIMSSTLDSEKGVMYSFHPIKFLYGVVEYVVPSDAIM